MKNILALFEETKRTRHYISTSGSVFSYSLKSNGKLKRKETTVNKKRGYVYIRTTKRNYILHRLVASAFIPNPYNKKTVNHKDGNKLNNSVENLEWATYKENAQHAIKNGFTRKMGKNEGQLKYTNKQCKKVLDNIKSGMKYVDAGLFCDMPYSTVAHLARGSRRKI